MTCGAFLARLILAAALALGVAARGMAQPKQVLDNCGNITLPAGLAANGYVDTNGRNCDAITSGGIIVGSAVPVFTATTADQPLTLILPGKFRIENPQFLVGTTTLNTTPLQINYAGGNACTAPGATLSPGQIDDVWTAAGQTQPHVCVPTGTLLIEVQQ